MNIPEQKKLLRREAETRRKELAASTPGAAARIAENVGSVEGIEPGAIVAGYFPMRGEADPLPLMKRLRAAGHRLALSRVERMGVPLTFHHWPDGVAPVRGGFVLREASPDWPEIVPDIVLVAMLAFDSDGYRLGYGGGFYDRTLRGLREKGPVLAVGVAFAGQEMAVPREDFDEPLDWIVTEQYARKFERN
jgi:5-formyltetrahydrofolate cyclo-ligase